MRIVAFHMEQLCTLVRILRKYLGGGRWDVQVGERHEKAGNLRLMGGGSGVEIVFGFSPNFSWCLLKFDNQYQ